MKELFGVKFEVTVSSAPLAKGLTKPFADALEKAVPILERAINGLLDIELKEQKEKEQKEN